MSGLWAPEAAPSFLLFLRLLVKPIWRPRKDSNLRTRFRKPMLYPLSYGGSAQSLAHMGDTSCPSPAPDRSHCIAMSLRHWKEHRKKRLLSGTTLKSLKGGSSRIGQGAVGGSQDESATNGKARLGAQEKAR